MYVCITLNRTFLFEERIHGVGKNCALNVEGWDTSFRQTLKKCGNRLQNAKILLMTTIKFR